MHRFDMCQFPFISFVPVEFWLPLSVMLACFSPVETWSKEWDLVRCYKWAKSSTFSIRSLWHVTSVALFPVLGCGCSWETFARVWATFWQQSSGIQTSNFTKALVKDNLNLLAKWFWSIMNDDNPIHSWPSKFSTATGIDDRVHTVNKHEINHIGDCQQMHLYCKLFWGVFGGWMKVS